MINVFLLIPRLFLEQSFNLVFLTSVTTWVYFAIIWLINKLYVWIVKQSDIVLTKLIFLEEIILLIWILLF